MPDENETIKRIIEFLERCGNEDIESGVGQVYGLSSKEVIDAFEAGLAQAIHDPGQ